MHAAQSPVTKTILRAYRGLTGGFLLPRNFSVAISVSPHVCFNSNFYVSKIMHL